MMQSLTKVQFLDGGFCTQFARLAGAKSWKWIRFHAVYVYLEHPIHGAALIDTGYGPHFFEATRGFPERLYRWMTPVTLKTPAATEPAQAEYGRRERVRRIFISHFHADHIAGLRCHPDAELVYRPEPLRRLRQQSAFSQVKHGFLSQLVPDDIAERGAPLADSRFTRGSDDLAAFLVCDYWGDGSLSLVDLPGHAAGHFGFVLQTDSERIFYIVDACWHLDVLLAGDRLPWPSRRFQADWNAYEMTQENLRNLARRSGWTLVACHCPRTMERVQRA